MINKRIPLRTTRDDVYMDTYIIDVPFDMPEMDYKYPTIVICPGGGYQYCSPREAEPIALNFNAAGFNAVVVHYSVGDLFPAALEDLSNAVVKVRENAEEWHVDTDKIIVSGGSAGGHLAASLGVFWNSEPSIKRADGLNKPNGMILSYPVITSGEKCHQGSIDILTGGDKALVSKVSLENQVNFDCPPTFIWHTFEDSGVPVENSLYMMCALAKEKIPMEGHIFPKGEHGLSLANEYVNVDGGVKKVQQWIDLAIDWIKEL